MENRRHGGTTGRKTPGTNRILIQYHGLYVLFGGSYRVGETVSLAVAVVPVRDELGVGGGVNGLVRAVSSISLDVVDSDRSAVVLVAVTGDAGVGRVLLPASSAISGTDSSVSKIGSGDGLKSSRLGTLLNK